MKGRKNLLEQLSSASNLQDEILPGYPLIEILGDKRVLIEHHCGVTEYGCQQICVNVKNGMVLVLGDHLQLALMTKEQLVITGRIGGIQLLGRGK